VRIIKLPKRSSRTAEPETKTMLQFVTPDVRPVPTVVSVVRGVR